jgi:hypothetical protein
MIKKSYWAYKLHFYTDKISWSITFRSNKLVEHHRNKAARVILVMMERYILSLLNLLFVFSGGINT